MDKFRVNLKKKMDKYIKLNGISYEYFNRLDGVKSLDGVSRNGGTTFKTLFQASKILNVDIRNFLMFDDYTYIFGNSFSTFEEFYCFLGQKFKKYRNEKNISAKEFVKKLKKPILYTSIYEFEGARDKISLKKFYEYLDVLEITPEEFFLRDEIYEIKGNDIKNQITIDDFNNRIYELEEIKGRIVGGNIAINPNTFPTLHGFLKICKSLGVSPRDFFDFDKKEFREDFKIIDISNSANFIKKKLELNGLKVQRYIKLDVIFLFCKEQNILIKDFFDVLNDQGNINQMYLNMLFLNTIKNVG